MIREGAARDGGLAEQNKMSTAECLVVVLRGPGGIE